jgi:hypothetical protein
MRHHLAVNQLSLPSLCWVDRDDLISFICKDCSSQFLWMMHCWKWVLFNSSKVILLSVKWNILFFVTIIIKLLRMWDFRFSQQRVWIWLSSGMLCLVVPWKLTNISEVFTVSIVMEAVGTSETGQLLWDSMAQHFRRQSSSAIQNYYSWKISYRTQVLLCRCSIY